jgi:hypothetical protein
MRPDFRGFLAWVLSAHDAGVASGCAADGIGKILLASIESFDALQPRPVKDPASAISHDQDPFQSSVARVSCGAARRRTFILQCQWFRSSHARFQDCEPSIWADKNGRGIIPSGSSLCSAPG